MATLRPSVFQHWKKRRSAYTDRIRFSNIYFNLEMRENFAFAESTGAEESELSRLRFLGEASYRISRGARPELCRVGNKGTSLMKKPTGAPVALRLRNAIPFCKCVMTPRPFPLGGNDSPSRENHVSSRQFRGNRATVPRGAIGYLEFRHRSRHGLIDFPIVRALVSSPLRVDFLLTSANTFGKSVPAETNELCLSGQLLPACLINIPIGRLTDELYKIYI